MSLRGMINSAKQLLGKLPRGRCVCATAPGGELWADPSDQPDADRWADDGGRVDDEAPVKLVARCPTCGGKYLLEIIEEIVEVADPELSPVGVPL